MPKQWVCAHNGVFPQDSALTARLLARGRSVSVPAMKTPAAHHPFYRPLWRRLFIVVTTAAWSAFEILHAKDGFWGVIAAAFFGYSLWTFLIAYKPPPET